MNQNAKNAPAKAHSPKTILNASIGEMLAPGRPAFSSVIRRLAKVGLFTVACAASAVTAHAAPPSLFTWNGAGTTSNWSDNNNWSGGAPSSGGQIHFAGTVDLSPVNDLNLTGPQSVNGLFFDANAGAFTLTGNSIGLSGGVTNNSSVTQVISLPISLNNSQTWTAASGGITVSITAPNSTLDLHGSVLTVDGPGTFDFKTPINDATSSSSDGFIKNGTGTTFLEGKNSYTGATLVNAGTLVVNGTIASTQTTVNSGALIAGNGTIAGNLTNNGFVAPTDFGSSDTNNTILSALSSGLKSINGASLSSTNLVLTVNGNYTQGAGGTLVIAYAGTGANAHNSLNVQGQATLNGTLYLIQVNGGRLTPGQEVPILTAAGGVTGKFSDVENAPLINATVVYEPTSVVLETSQGSVANTLSGIRGISGNFLSVGRGLDSAASDPRAAKIFSVLNSDNLNQLLKDVGHIDPDKLTSMSTVGGATSGVHLQNLQMRMQALQSGATGFSAMGFHVTDNTPSSTTTDTTAIGYAGPTGPDGKGGKEVAPPPADNRWGTFITGAGEFDHVGDTQSARGFNLDSGGITLGIDYRFTDHFVAGIFAGYTYTGIDISDGRIAVDSGKFGIYGTYFDGGFYINSAVQGGYDGYEINRTSLGGNAHSSPTGGDFNLLFAPGYNWTAGGLTFGPTTRFQYSYESVGGFTESGSLAPLAVGSQHTESIVSAVGMKASYDWKVGTTIIRPELRLEWEHEYGDVSTTIASQLASGAGSSFNVTGPAIGRDDLHLGAGVSVVFSDQVTAYVYYDGQYFRTNYDSSTVTGGFRFLF